ncbi:MAG: HlyD family efflux transporter periplasmic adaptor subunit [Bacteroidota bacterium]
MNTYLNTPIEAVADESKLASFQNIYRVNRKSTVKSWLWGTLILLVIVMFLPWTQNIRAKGTITTLRQEQRPQQVNTIIAGAAIKWFVKEGDYVNAGDTILQLGEVKVDYFDPKLVERTAQQIEAKRQSIEGYRNKATSTITQADALAEARELKLQSLDNKIVQQQLKVQTDEADLIAANNELEAYKRQINAARIMLDSGAISLTEFEKRKVNYQNGLAKTNSSNNKLLQSKQELTNLRIEKQAIIQEYADKIAKADGDRFSSLSNAASTEAEVSKLENQYANYDARNKLYYIVASQSGQITKAKKAGIGEFVKEGEMIVEIVPDHIQYAVELYVDPMDLPLVNMGQEVQFVFDGFPAIVFSGWPENNYGTFAGKIAAVETSVSYNGKFRVLVVEDTSDRKWPKQLRMGGGAQGIMLLKDVRIYYELWRNINGFPPDYYKPAGVKNTDSKEQTK